MSYSATSWAYDLPLRGSMKPVLVALADMADESNSCFPGQAKIAAMTGLSTKTVERALAKLEKLGALTREHRHDSRGYRTSDRYVLNVGLTVTLPTRQIAYKAESLQGNVSEPNGHSDGAIRAKALKNHQENHQIGDAVDEDEIPKGTSSPKPLPRPFVVTKAMREWAASKTPSLNVDAVTAEFVAYWREGEGKGRRKKNWTLTWMNWLRKTQPPAPVPIRRDIPKTEEWMYR